ncbi:MAG TPA: gamma-glutamyl-gamma-aminobutyrate hydrolase family protein [Gemmatimonadaceae bacterium]|nr:gamma-glutamyl-gamma-aminobutyrate hydrolase family protein [Gemmatimonadaceae bacterium]
MERRPIIGVTTQTLEAIPDELPRCWVMSQRYVQTLATAGGVPFVIPLLPDDTATLRAIYEQLDGLLLPGGVDMAPESYGASPHPGLGRTDIDRDRTELQLVRWAIAERKPVLGICRGVQVINVAAGGTLYQDLATECEGAIKHDYFPHQGTNPRDQLVHDVSIPAKSRLGRILQEDSARVNSMHHQGIREVGARLVPSAFAPDGVIEGIESTTDHFLVGVQWHPEDLTHKDWHMRQLFAALLEAANEFYERRVVVSG